MTQTLATELQQLATERCGVEGTRESSRNHHASSLPHRVRRSPLAASFRITQPLLA